MKQIRLFVIGLVLLLLSGCFQVTTVVRVNPDGSGTVEERMLISKKVVAQIEETMRSFEGAGEKVEGAGEKGKPFDLFQSDQLKKQARSMGKGVTYLSGKRVETPDYKGYLATYKFTDINTLKLQHRNASQFGNNESETPFVNFRFKKGPTSTLVIVLPGVKTSKTAQAAPDAESPEQSAPVAESTPEIFIPPQTSAQDTENSAEIYTPPPPPSQPKQSDQQKKELMEMFMGMKFALAVEVNGTIVSTDATYRDGNRLTIFDFDMTKLGNLTPAELEKLSLMKNGSLDEVKELLKTIPGVKAEMNEKLTVVFGKNRPRTASPQ